MIVGQTEREQSRGHIFPGTGGHQSGEKGTGGTCGGSGGVPTTGGTGGGGHLGGGAGVGGQSVTCTSTCSNAEKICSSTSAIATCVLGPNGCWNYGTPATCPGSESCSGQPGAAKCDCISDPICSVAGSVCVDSSTIVSCVEDAEGCLHPAEPSGCSNGACSGVPGAASCCVNDSCTEADSTCLSSERLQVCAVGPNGCVTLTTSACPTGSVCERQSPPTCEDPNWAAWPVESSGLMWSATNPRAIVPELDLPGHTQVEAVSYCRDLVEGGYDDWRLPSMAELAITFAFPSEGFALPDVSLAARGIAWTTTPFAAGPGAFWGIDTWYGSVTYADNTVVGYVKCVR